MDSDGQCHIQHSSVTGVHVRNASIAGRDTVATLRVGVRGSRRTQPTRWYRRLSVSTAECTLSPGKAHHSISGRQHKMDTGMSPTGHVVSLTGHVVSLTGHVVFDDPCTAVIVVVSCRRVLIMSCGRLRFCCHYNRTTPVYQQVANFSDTTESSLSCECHNRLFVTDFEEHW